MIDIKLVFFWIMVICLHEFWHYVGFLIYNYKPKIIFKWYGISIGSNVLDYMKPIEIFWVAYLGVLFPMFIFFFEPSQIYLYLFMCMLDFSTMLQTFQLRKFKIPMYKIYYKMYLECKNGRNNTNQ